MITYGCNKPDHFIDFYKKYLIPRKPKVLLEIGVQTGKSLKMWKKALPGSSIVGLDNTEPGEIPHGVMFVGADQTNEQALQSIGTLDAVIDDGSHMSYDQQKSFEILWKQLNPGGVYIIEDLEIHRQGEFKNTDLTTYEYFLEKTKPILVNDVLKPLFVTEGIKTITFGDNFLAVEKV